MKHVFSLALALVIVLLIINIISEDAAVPDANAVATHIEGTASVYTKEAPEGRVIHTNDIVAKDAQIRVQENSRLELRFPDGTYMRLSENARFTMRLLKFEKRTGSLSVQALLQAGKLWAKVKKLSTPAAKVEVIAGTGLAAAKGTVYGMDLEEDRSTTVKVYEGTVLTVNAPGEGRWRAELGNAPPEGQPVSVGTFQKVTVSARKGISQPLDFDPKATIDDWIRWNLQRDAREGLVSITVTPAGSTITRGVSRQISGTGNYSDNTVKDITWFATWSSSDRNVAAIDPTGVATGGKQPGTADLSASIVDMSGSAALNVTRELVSINVTPASRSVVNGAVQQFTAAGKFSDKTVQDITSSVVWKSSDAGVAVVSAGGRATAGNKEGKAVITASLGNKKGFASLMVRRELLSISIIPAGATIMEGKTQQFSARGNFSDKTTQDVTASAKWQLSDAKVAVISGTGLATGKAEGGTTTITAAFGGKIGSGTVTVTKRALVALTVNPAEATIRQMVSQRFTVLGSFSDGSTQDLTKSVAWTSSAPLVAPIKDTGIASGVVVGSAVITATCQGKSATSTLTVIEREIYRPRADEDTAKKFIYWPTPRFAKVSAAQPTSGAVVIDRLTGLLWTADAATPGPPACSSGVALSWPAAVAYVACLNNNRYLGYRNWRLPSREEIFSILDYKQSIPNPLVYTQGFSYTQAFYGYDVWFAGEGGIMSYADLSLGVSYYADGSRPFYVWPVRSVK